MARRDVEIGAPCRLAPGKLPAFNGMSPTDRLLEDRPLSNPSGLN